MHPYDDKDIIIGQSSLGMEIAIQMAKKNMRPDVIVLGVGGGGCACGVSLAMKMVYDNVKI